MQANDQLTSLVSAVVGQYEIIRDHRGDNKRTGVFEILADKKRYFVKIHNRLSRWNPEIFAYTHWTEAIIPYSPTLVSTFNEDDLFGIIITPITGMTVNERQIEDDEKLSRIYHRAGQLFRKMQGSGKGEYFGIPRINGSPYDSIVYTDPVEYVFDSLNSQVKTGYDIGTIDSSAKPLMDWCLENCGIFSDEVPVPTNWDFSPQNWMVDESGELTGFIDFENMLWGISLDSFNVVLERPRYAFHKPHLAEALFQGYCLDNDEKTQQKLKILKTKLALIDTNYGHTVNDSYASYVHECGKGMLARLIDAHDK